MKEVLVLSGKGGTGKTSLVSSFIYLEKACIACDYDVDASNLPILFDPDRVERHDFSAGFYAEIDSDLCIECGQCEALCRFEAIEALEVNELLCEGCGLCSQACPVEAVILKKRSSGKWFEGFTAFSTPLFFAELEPGEENSGKLVAQVKNAARKKAQDEGIELLISDGPPGIGCSAISSLVAVKLAVIVAEPAVTAFHDVKRVGELIEQRGVKALLVINKYDLDVEISSRIEAWAKSQGISCVGKVPFKSEIAYAVAAGQIPAVHSELKDYFLPVWKNIKKHL